MERTLGLGIGLFRICYGGFFVAVALYGLWSLVQGGGNPFPVPPGPGADLQDALLETGFVIPIMLACFLVGGSALLLRRTTPLGLVILAPLVTVIFFYHVMLGGSVIWAAFWAAGLLLLAWCFRGAFRSLVCYED